MIEVTDEYDDSPWTREELELLAWETGKHIGWEAMGEYDEPFLEKSIMATSKVSPKCGEIVQKMLSGVSLAEIEKIHLAKCESCLDQLVTALEESSTHELPSGSTHGELTHARPEATKALEHGPVFLR